MIEAALVLVVIALLVERGWSSLQHRKYVERVSDLLAARNLTEAATSERLRVIRNKRKQREDRSA